MIDLVALTFPIYRAKLMKGLDWGLLYNEYGNNEYDPNELEAEIKTLLQDEGKIKHWTIEEMHADHIIPWSKGGHTTLENGQMLCREHNLAKGSK